MSVLTVNDASTSGNKLTGTGAVYATVQAGAGTTNSVNYIEVGQNNVYYIARCGLIFSTTALASTVGIQSATVSVYGNTADANTTYSVVLVSGTALADTIVSADFQELLAATVSLGSISMSAVVMNGWNNIPLNTAGLAAIVKGGTTRFGLRSSKDINVTTPIGDEAVAFNGPPQSNPPKITITYGEGEAAGIIGVVGETFHYVSKTGVEYVVQGTVV